MARPWKGPTWREEILLRWYMEQNLRALIRKRDRKLFNRFFAQQKKIKGFLGWDFRPMDDASRLEFLLEAAESLTDRYRLEEFDRIFEED